LKLSIITINFNNAAGLERTIKSVLQQSFPNVEYLVFDGGSTDGSKDIIEANAKKLSYWVSEKDEGVYHAMNKGIAKANGEYVLFLNSGDYLVDNEILLEVSGNLDGTEIVYGNVFLIENETKKWTGIYPDKLSFQYFRDGSLPHPCSFIKRSLFAKVGYYDETIMITADWKFFLDAICRNNATYKHINKVVSVFFHDGMSSIAANQEKMKEEKHLVLQKEYPAFLADSIELARLRSFKNNKTITRFTKVARRLGFLKDS
jgi:glycosyltransferase involved in cell wall biosynthesis